MLFPLVTTLLFAAPATPLDDAARALERPELKRAALALRRARALEHLARDQVLTFYELEAKLAAAQGDDAAARAAFLTLLTIEPSYEPPQKLNPRLATPFYEAKAGARERGPLALSSAPAASGSVVFLLAAPDGLVNQVRVRLTEDGAVREVLLPVASRIVVPVRGSRTSATAVALGAQGWVLTPEVAALAPPPPLQQPSEPPQPSQPVSAEDPPANPPRSALLPEPPPPPAPPLETAQTEPAAGGSGLHGAGFAFAAISVAGLATGLVCGLLSRQGRDRFERDTTLTHSGALALDGQVRGLALAANVGFGVAGGAALLAAVLWLIGLKVEE